MADNDQNPGNPKDPKSPKDPKKAQASPKLAKIIEEIEKLSVIELAELVKALEKKFGVAAVASAAATSVAAAPEGQAAGEGTPAGQTTFNVILTSAGTNKISAIKAVRELNQTLGLKEAKDLVESVPKEVLTGVNQEEADKAKKRLEEAGATVELK